MCGRPPEFACGGPAGLYPESVAPGSGHGPVVGRPRGDVSDGYDRAGWLLATKKQPGGAKRGGSTKKSAGPKSGGTGSSPARGIHAKYVVKPKETRDQNEKLILERLKMDEAPTIQGLVDRLKKIDKVSLTAEDVGLKLQSLVAANLVEQVRVKNAASIEAAPAASETGDPDGDRILNQLRADGPSTDAALAPKVGMSVAKVDLKLDKLIRQGFVVESPPGIFQAIA